MPIVDAEAAKTEVLSRAVSAIAARSPAIARHCRWLHARTQRANPSIAH
jgi:hypothetical protein